MRHLCDSNVFLALAASGHPRHPTALAWFEALPGEDVACFCRMTQNSFLRLLTTDEIMRPFTLTNTNALVTYRAMLQDKRIEFALEPANLEEAWLSLGATPHASPKLWMDAYLAALSQTARMQFVTFDRAFRQFRKLGVLILGD